MRYTKILFAGMIDVSNSSFSFRVALKFLSLSSSTPSSAEGYVSAASFKSMTTSCQMSSKRPDDVLGPPIEIT